MFLRSKRDRRDQLPGISVVPGRRPRLLAPARVGAGKRDWTIPARRSRSPKLVARLHLLSGELPVLRERHQPDRRRNQLWIPAARRKRWQHKRRGQRRRDQTRVGGG